MSLRKIGGSLLIIAYILALSAEQGYDEKLLLLIGIGLLLYFFANNK